MTSKQNPCDRPYFFDKGLRFECTGCGMCCTGESGTIFVSGRESIRIAEHLGVSTKQFIFDFTYPVEEGHSLKEMRNGDCVFLNGNLCGIYSVRPTQCRTFPFWPETLRSERGWNEAGRGCEGIGRGKLFTRDEIMRELNRTLDECADAEW